MKGGITIWILVFGSVFLIILSATVGFLVFQIKENQKAEMRNIGFHIAEAGINYSRWHLAHSPEDYSFSGTYDYKDVDSETAGQYELQITAPSGCSPGVKIESTGWQDDNIKKEIRVLYAKSSLAEFGFLTNSNVWFGTNENLKGPFHSNGGIRMDGTQNSLSTSAKEIYTCGPEHGCSPPEQKPGIWGTGQGQSQGLWQFPVSNVDFDGIVQDMAVLKAEAQSSGIYLASTTDYGYHIVFNSDATFDVYTVTSLQDPVWGYDGEEWINESNSINNETFYQTFNMPSDCAPVFVEDNLWVDGSVNGRIVVVAARLPDVPGTNAKVIIPDNISYVGDNSVLGLIAQKDILIPLYSPDNLSIKAAMLAQKGHVFRYYYPDWWYEPYASYAMRSNITTYGSIITNTIWTFTWVNSSEQVVSGYAVTEMNYDADLTYSPPPYFPVTSEYEIASWEEID